MTAAVRIDYASIYATDLVYLPGCWQLCGDAHCCSFRRHKARFRLIGTKPVQELPLLPGEYAHLRENGFLAQFQDHEHRVLDYAFGTRSLRLESIVSRRPGCACDHGTRPTICRLYPLLPVFDMDGHLTGVERIGIYDALAEMDGQEKVCQVDRMSFSELEKFLAIAATIARDPRALFYVAAYRLAHDHVRQRLAELKGDGAASFFSVFESSLLRGKLVDHAQLGAKLAALADTFEARYGREFSLP